MSFISDQLASKIDRRNLLRLGGFAGASLVGGGLLAGCGGSDDNNNNSGGGKSRARDLAILNFALHLEYLEAEYYVRAVTGAGLTGEDSGGTGTVTGPTTPQAALTGNVLQYAREIASDEQNHVRALRATITALGGTPVSKPDINLRESFNAALGTTFDAFASEDNFLLGAFLFEDVGVTAYKGAARLIQSADVLEAAAGFLSVEAYHAGAIRALIVANGLGGTANAISDARAGLGGGNDQGVTVADPSNSLQTGSTLNLVPADASSLAFSRTTAQVLNIVYLGSTPTTTPTTASFFPNGVNGSIR